MSMWCEKICAANLKTGNTRCRKLVVKGSDFCNAHIKTHKYGDHFLSKKKTELKNDTNVFDRYIDLILDEFDCNVEKQEKFLDENYEHCLIGVNDSWKEVPWIYWFKCGNSWWNITTLMSTLTMQLNQSELGKPFPLFPEDPFTRQKYDDDVLTALKNKIDVLKKSIKDFHVHMTLNTFLSLSKTQWDNIRNDTTQYNAASKLINVFSLTMRYKMINMKNSQGGYCGYWVNKDTHLSEFEKCLNKIETSAILYFNNIPVIFNNSVYRNVIDKFNSLPKEDYVL